MNKIILLDSNSLLYRAYHAMPALTNSKGQFTGAIFGFVNMLSSLLESEKPTHVAAVFDVKAPTFRHKMYDGYKATRKPMPEELVAQLPVLKELLSKLNITILEEAGYEADDILGTIAKRFNAPTLIVTGDRDCLQLVSPTTHVYLTKKGIKDVVVYNEARLLEDGFTPQMFIDYKALMGDTSDNVKGVDGVGEVTAKKLITEYKTLENVMANAASIKGKLGEKIAAASEAVELSKKLVTINTEVPLHCTLADIVLKYPFPAEAKDMLLKLEFNSLIKRIAFETPKEELISMKDKVKTLIVDNNADFDKLLGKLSGKRISVVFGDEVHLAADDATEYIVVPQRDLFSGMPFDEIVDGLKKLFFRADTDKVLFDYKAFLHAADCGLFKGKIYDTMLLAHIVKGGKSIAKLLAVLNMYGYEGGCPAVEQLLVCDTLTEECGSLGLNDLYDGLELPLVAVLYDMECNGFKVDRDVLSELNEKYKTEIAELTDAIYAQAGRPFNINSPKQLATVLFEEMQLPSGKKNKSGFSVGVEVLNDIKELHPIVSLILRYRQITKLQSTYIEGLLPLINKEGKLHTEFKQAITSTGRLSSVEPNLQNIPTREAEGREIRRAFLPSEGNTLVSADYSQIELRLLAHFSGDESLIKAYRESRDIHTATASEIFGVSPDMVDAGMRRDAKAVNFGIIYGISDWGLANNLSISPKRAKAFITKYLDTYPKVKEYMDANVAYAKEHGYIKTLSGRIRFIPEINSGSFNQRSFGERAAMNMPLQGTAADIIKIAMLKVFEALRGKKSKLILQVHDELIIDTTPDEIDEVKAILTECMEHAVELRVPLTVNIDSGKNWFEAK